MRAQLSAFGCIAIFMAFLHFATNVEKVAAVRKFSFKISSAIVKSFLHAVKKVPPDYSSWGLYRVHDE